MKKKTQTFYDLASQDQQYRLTVGSSAPKNIENYDKVQRLLKFALRPYQVEALSAFQLFWKDGFDSRSLKQKTLQQGKDDDNKVVDISQGFAATPEILIRPKSAVNYVLEVNPNSGIKIGDTVTLK